MADLTAGWGFPGNARKAHYFPAHDSFSVCGRWGFYMGRREPETGQRSPDDCAVCVKKLPAQASSSASPEGEVKP